MEEALVERLGAVSAISTRVTDRISFFGFQRGDTPNGIALSVVTPGEEWTHGGPDGLNEPRVRFDIRGNDADDVMAIKRAVITEMHQAADVDDTRFHPASLEAEREIPLGEQPGGAGLLQWQLEFLFFHEEIEP